MLSHLGAMLARLEAMLAQHARKKRQKTNKKANKNNNAAKKAKTPCYGGFAPGSPQVPPRVGGRFGARLAQLWGRWPTLGAVSPLLGHVGPIWALCCPILILCWPILNICETFVVQSWPDVGPKKIETQKAWKNQWIRKVLATMLRLCWPSFEAMLVHLGAMLAHLGAMLARLRAMLAHLGR